MAVQGLSRYADHLNFELLQKKVTYTISSRKLNIAMVPNVSPMCTLPSHMRPKLLDVRPTVTYYTVIYLHTNPQPCVGRRGCEIASGLTRLNTLLYTF